MKKLIKTGDLIVIASILAIAAGLFLIRLSAWKGRQGLRAEIVSDGKVIEEIDLNGLSGERLIETEGCIIRAGHGGIAFIEADCPDHLCVKSGILTRPGDMAACVPNKTMIRIVGSEETDAVTY